MTEIRDNARKMMEPYCKVCPICNGKACAGQVPGMGSLDSGSSFISNIKALPRIKFNMRLIHDVIEPDITVNVLGKKLVLLILATPIAGVSFNMGDAVSEEDYIQAIINGCSGDSVPDFIHQAGFNAIKSADGHGSTLH